ncbi:hypothetical protein ACOBQJ_03025 [Pelotomaculum propionicicum]|uniref:hypothetical protein n=1 Tax=Pelotomaculum propionicicum TaxID=258475 RepID=UPI003B766463
MSKTVDVFCASSVEKDMETYGLVISRGHEKIYSASGVVYSTPGAGNYNAVAAALGWLLTNGYAGDTTTIYIGNYQCVMQINLRKEMPPILCKQHRENPGIYSGDERWEDK